MIPAAMAIAGNVNAQRVSISLKDVTIREALHAVERESGYSFFYNDAFADLSRKVSIDAKDQLLSDVITTMLKGTTLTYKFLEGKLIVIVLKGIYSPKANHRTCYCFRQQRALARSECFRERNESRNDHGCEW